MTTTDRKPIVLIGIGNPLRRDDGIGPLALDAVRADPIPGCDIVELDGEATRLIEAWRNRDMAIVVDAISTGAAPGTLHDLALDEIDGVGMAPSATSSHFAGVAEALALGRSLNRLPAELRVVGIEPDDLTFGPGLSPPVSAAIDRLVRTVREALMASTTVDSP